MAKVVGTTYGNVALLLWIAAAALCSAQDAQPMDASAAFNDAASIKGSTPEEQAVIDGFVDPVVPQV